MKSVKVSVLVSVAFFFGAVSAARAENWYTSKTDNRRSSGDNYYNDSFKLPEFWVSDDGTKMAEFSIEDEYYAHHDLYLKSAPSFPGGRFHIGDIDKGKTSKVWLYYAGVTANKGLVLEKGGFYTRRSVLPASYNLFGPVTVLSPASDPFKFNLSQYHRSTFQIHGSINGDKTTGLYLDSDSKTNIVYILADVANYHGLITVTSTVERASRLTGARLAFMGAAFPGSLDMSNSTTLQMEASAVNSEMTISNMTFRTGSCIVIGGKNGAHGSFVATGSLKAETGVEIYLNFGVPVSKDEQRIVLLSAPENNAEFSKDDFILTVSADNWMHQYHLETEVVNDVKMLIAVFEPIVTQIGQFTNEYRFDTLDSSHWPSSLTNASHWADDEIPHGGVNYYTEKNIRTPNEPDIAGVFPGKSLVLSNGKLRVYHKEYTVTNLIVTKGYVQYGRQGGLRTFHSDMISVLNKSTLTFEAFLGKGIDIDSEISGNGRLWFSGLTSGNSTSPSGYYILRKLNEDFLGTVCVSQFINASGYINFASKFQTLRIAHGRCLGGRLPELNPAALTLANYSRLMTIEPTVELEDGFNRGVYIQGCGRFFVDSADGAEKLICNWPITMNGAFYKEGDGRLELGGEVRFQGDDAIGDTPRANSNLFFVSKGTLVPRRHNCCDGMAISFSKNTKLVVPLVAGNADLLKWGLYNVKEGGSVAIAENLEVDFDLTECPQPPAKEFSVGIVTVANTPAAVEAIRGKLKLGSTTYKGYRRAKLVEDEDEKSGTVTFAGKFVQDGLSVTVR